MQGVGCGWADGLCWPPRPRVCPPAPGLLLRPSFQSLPSEAFHADLVFPGMLLCVSCVCGDHTCGVVCALCDQMCVVCAVCEHVCGVCVCCDHACGVVCAVCEHVCGVCRL